MRNNPRFISTIQKLVMILVGKWFKNFNNQTLTAVYKTYSFFIEWFFFFMTQNILLSIIIFRNCPERAAELFCYYIQYLNSNICSLLSKRKNMRRIFNLIFEHDERMTTASNVYTKYTNLNKKSAMFFFTSSMFVAIYWYITTFKISLSTTENDTTCVVQKGISYQLWYPFDMYNKCYPLTLTLDILLFFTAILTHIYNKITPVSVFIFALGQLKALQQRLRQIEERSSDMVQEQNMEFVVKEIIECIKMHQKIISLMSLIESACKEIVLIGFFTNSLEIAAFIVYVLTSNIFIRMVVSAAISALVCFQLFLTFWFANEILVESVAISDIIYYETNWINFDKKAKQLLRMMMARAQKPLCINLPALGYMSMEIFKRIMKLCYSIVTFVKTIYL
ncbi:hypothetical protein NQ315_000897 [Exocentrus adspersus]|uniref:Odorant receptor n=1 Tax=Exocentrus adspersus TaxID=1586481 RepID=A0AAV8WDQ3_9CUCU|nr:hypothetical protein NQ315_000897 [Exocentrus adspersus]